MIRRLAIGLALLSGPVLAGAAQLTPWSMVPLIGIFAVARIAEYAERSQHALRLMSPRDRAKTVLRWIPGILLQQTIGVTLFFALAWGVGAMFGASGAALPLWLPLALSGAGVFAALLSFPRRRQDGAPPKPPDLADYRALQPLFLRWHDLGAMDVIMPTEIFALARELADHRDRAYVGGMLEDNYWVFDGPFQRRVVFTYLRFTADDAPFIEDFAVLLLDGLRSPHDWVRYDAAWACQALEYDDPEIDAALAVIASEAVGPESREGSTARACLYRKADEMLAARASAASANPP